MTKAESTANFDHLVFALSWISFFPPFHKLWRPDRSLGLEQCVYEINEKHNM